jgi:DNA-binding response OmpR family regulator
MPLHVMIVEDEPLIGAAMQMLVEDIGGTVSGPHITLADGLAAVGTGSRVDYALLDCNLGRETSWPIAEALAARGIPFAFTSGKGIGDIDPRFADRPVFAKPVDENKLKSFLEGLNQP